MESIVDYGLILVPSACLVVWAMVRSLVAYRRLFHKSCCSKCGHRGLQASSHRCLECGFVPTTRHTVRRCVSITSFLFLTLLVSTAWLLTGFVMLRPQHLPDVWLARIVPVDDSAQYLRRVSDVVDARMNLASYSGGFSRTARIVLFQRILKSDGFLRYDHMTPNARAIVLCLEAHPWLTANDVRIEVVDASGMFLGTVFVQREELELASWNEAVLDDTITVPLSNAGDGKACIHCRLIVDKHVYTISRTFEKGE